MVDLNLKDVVAVAENRDTLHNALFAVNTVIEKLGHHRPGVDGSITRMLSSSRRGDVFIVPEVLGEAHGVEAVVELIRTKVNREVPVIVMLVGENGQGEIESGNIPGVVTVRKFGQLVQAIPIALSQNDSPPVI